MSVVGMNVSLFSVLKSVGMFLHEYSFSAITLDNTLVILSTVAPDAGRYYAQAVNDKNGENKTSQPVTLTVESKYTRNQMYTGAHAYTHI